MTARDPDVMIGAFLGEGPTELPNRTYDGVREHIHHTRQRVAIGPWREPNMMTFAKVAIAAAAVVAVGLAWINLGRSQTGVGSGPTSSPSAAPTSSPASEALPAATLEPGTTYRISAEGSVGSHPMTFTVPGRDWFAIDTTGIVGKDVLGEKPMYDIAFSMWRVGNVYADACRWTGTELDPILGRTVDDLANALSAQIGRSGTQPTDVTIDGYSGKKVELSLPADLDPKECDGGEVRTWIAATGGGYGGFVYGAGQKNTVYILDVDGERLVIDTMYLPGTSAETLAELDQIIDSIDIEP
jgi:hypothetical protein